MKSILKQRRHGFTLLESILTLIVASVLGAMVYSYFGTAFTYSSTPIARLNATFVLHRAMEQITEDYNRQAVWRATTVYAIDDLVVPTTRNAHRYRCTGAGTSGAAEPSWPTGIASTVVDGTVTWTEDTPPTWVKNTAYALGDRVLPTTKNGHRYVCTVAGRSENTEPTWPLTNGGTVIDREITWTEFGELADLRDNINALVYGTYTVLENKYIKFNGSTSQEENIVSGDPENMLKVTIQNALGERLTTLFTTQD